MQSIFRLNDADFTLWLSRRTGGYALHRDGAGPAPAISLRPDPAVVAGGASRYLLAVDGDEVPVVAAQDGDDLFIHLDGRTYDVRYLEAVRYHAGAATASSEDEVRAPMPGMALSVPVKPGQAVEAGDVLVVIESMKVETRCLASRAGTVQTVHVAEGQGFDRDQVLVTLQKAG